MRLESLRTAGFNAGIVARTALQAMGRRQSPGSGPKHLFVAVVDHFEPGVGRAASRVRKQRMEAWSRLYPAISARHQDADGCHPPHSFFYPWDEFLESEGEALAQLSRDGWGEVDLHLHHRDDTEASLRAKLRGGVEALERLGCLSKWPNGKPAWGFIHGNWALDNSRCEHGENFCGVNNELEILQSEGCYADFTFPAWRKSAQPRHTNTIIRAQDDPARAKSYDQGKAVRVGNRKDGFLLVQGPLVPYVERTPRKVRLAMDDGDLAASRRYHPDRLDRWVRAGIHVKGHPDWVFIKLHCHGAADGNREALLEQDLDALYSDLTARYNDGRNFLSHFVSAREMFNLVSAAESGYTGNPYFARDWVLPSPNCAQSTPKKCGNMFAEEVQGLVGSLTGIS